jgi:hypothetical protein
MPYLNLDLNYFEHRKTRRLVGLLGRGSEVLPVRLWIYCGKFHCETGKLAGYDEKEIESLAEWWGKSGDMLPAMLKAGFMYQEGNTWGMTAWTEHQGHISAYALRGKMMAEARWGKVRTDAASIATSNAASNALTNLTNLTDLSKPTKPNDKASKAFAKLTEGQRGIVERCEFALGEQWTNDAGKWVVRIKSNIDKSARVIAEVENATKEGRVKTTPAQYAEQIWKEFK